MHSAASFDSSVDPERLRRRCRALGLGPIFLTDHDTVDAAVKLRASYGAEIVVGQEVMTREGEIIGLFLDSTIPAGLQSSEAVGRIRDQGGLVYLQHPYDRSRRALTEDAIERLAGEIDVVEVFNGRASERSNERAEGLRMTLGVAAGAGSDAHTEGEVGAVYIQMEAFAGASDFLLKLRRGSIVRHPSRLRMGLSARLPTRFPRW